jgi:hypothetical protein
MKLTPYDLGWNAWLDSKSQDDNPWAETSHKGHMWMLGMIHAENKADAHGLDNTERKGSK